MVKDNTINYNMVKNAGGNKSKKMGRKFVSQAHVQRKLRLSEDEDEMYACVSKMLGNGMCYVLGIDNTQRLCIIRNKFRGRSKRHNLLNPGSWVLIGERSWETKKDGTNKYNTCDLLEVYTDSEVAQMKERVNEKWSVFKTIENMNQSKVDEGVLSADDTLGFEIKESVVDLTVVQEINDEMNKEPSVVIVDEDEIDIDDI